MTNQDSYYRLSGFTRDLLFSKNIFVYDLSGNRVERLRKIAIDIKKRFLKADLCEDLITYGSLAYGGHTHRSDIDLLGMDRRINKIKKYFFRIKSGNEIIPVEVRVDDGKNHYYARSSYKVFPNDNSELLKNPFPKCWAIIAKDVFSSNSLMQNLAKIDSLECLGALLKVELYEKRQNNITYVTPTELANKLKEKFSETKRRGLFEKRRWERGLKTNTVKTLRSSMNYADFWVKKKYKDTYVIKKAKGLAPSPRVYSRLYVLSRVFDISNTLYLIDTFIYNRLPKIFEK
jgi:hypothetical protein